MVEKHLHLELLVHRHTFQQLQKIFEIFRTHFAFDVDFVKIDTNESFISRIFHPLPHERHILPLLPQPFVKLPYLLTLDRKHQQMVQHPFERQLHLPPKTTVPLMHNYTLIFIIKFYIDFIFLLQHPHLISY